MGVEDDLRRVLADDRLDLPVRAGAEQSLLAGARRRKRRREAGAVVGGVLAVAVIGAGGYVLAGYEARGPVPPAEPPSVTSTPSPGRVEPPGRGPSRDADSSPRPAAPERQNRGDHGRQEGTVRPGPADPDVGRGPESQRPPSGAKAPAPGPAGSGGTSGPAPSGRDANGQEPSGQEPRGRYPDDRDPSTGPVEPSGSGGTMRTPMGPADPTGDRVPTRGGTNAGRSGSVRPTGSPSPSDEQQHGPATPLSGPNGEPASDGRESAPAAPADGGQVTAPSGE